MPSKQNTLLIIYPHWHPANLAGVHRPRLIGNYLKDFGWKARVLTVKEEYFEEIPDPDFAKTFSPDFEVTRVEAKKLRKLRIIGDIGLRAYKSLRNKSLEIIREESIDFVWIPIPSFYMALLGPYLNKYTGVPYGIDYIDPWVRDITNQRNPRSVISQWIARVLEPKAVREASLITGVSMNYYEPVLQRNNLRERKPHPVHDAEFPYGFDPNDHRIKLDGIEIPWGNTEKSIWLYTGAFLPNSHYFIKTLFRAIAELKAVNKRIQDMQFYFLGTGAYPSKRITAYAEDHGIQNQVVEIRERFPYLHTLNFQSRADTVMIIGSTEKHYTASKTYQSLLSERPIFSILHSESQALEVLNECKASEFNVMYQDGMDEDSLTESIKQAIEARLQNEDWKPDLSQLDKYSAKESARKLIDAIEGVRKQNTGNE